MRTVACAVVLALAGLSAGAANLDDRLKALASDVDKSVQAASWVHGWKKQEEKPATTPPLEPASKGAAPPVPQQEDIAAAESKKEEKDAKGAPEEAPKETPKEEAKEPEAPKLPAVLTSTKPIQTFDELEQVLQLMPANGAVAADAFECSGSTRPDADACFAGDMPLGEVNGTDAGSMRIKVKFNSNDKIHVTILGHAMGREILILNLGRSVSNWWSLQTTMQENALKKALPLRYGYCADQSALQVNADINLFSAKAMLPNNGDCP